MTLEKVVLILLPLGHHTPTSSKGSCPDPIGKRARESSFPAEKLLRLGDFSTFVLWMCKCCVSTKISLWTSVRVLRGDAAMDEERVIHHGAICLNNSPVRTGGFLLKYRRLPQVLLCVYILGTWHSVKGKMTRKIWGSVWILRVQVKIMRPRWFQTLSTQNYWEIFYYRGIGILFH